MLKNYPTSSLTSELVTEKNYQSLKYPSHIWTAYDPPNLPDSEGLNLKNLPANSQPTLGCTGMQAAILTAGFTQIMHPMF